MNEQQQGKGYVVMGVSSSGKSTVGAALAKAIGAKFIDGDDLHPKANIIKMKNSRPLNDDDRGPWLERVRDAAFSLEQKNEVGVIVCSALKRRYRDIIREGNNNVTFLHLTGDFELVLERMRGRQGHYMPVELLKSQFDALEPPTPDETDVIPIDIDATPDDIVARCVEATGQPELATDQI